MKAVVRVLLQEARINIVAAAGDLDRTETTCDHCTRKVYANWDEAQMARELEAIVHKLDKWMNKKYGPARVGPEIGSAENEGQ